MEKVTAIDSKPSRKRKPRLPARAKSSQPSQEQQEKSLLAYQMRVAGVQPSEIATALGISHVHDVYRLLAERYSMDIDYTDKLDRKSILYMEVTRLDALQAAVWPSAMMGDPKSIDSAIKIIATRAKITGLEQVDPVVQKNLVLVMGEKESDYIAALKAASDD